MSEAKSAEDWNDIREDIIKQADGECELCGMSREEHREQSGGDRDLHVHHIIPRSEGGGDYVENLMAVCHGCHRRLEQVTDKIIRYLNPRRDRAEEMKSQLESLARTFDDLWRRHDGHHEELEPYLSHSPTFKDRFSIYDEGTSDNGAQFESRELQDWLNEGVGNEWQAMYRLAYAHGMMRTLSEIDGRVMFGKYRDDE